MALTITDRGQAHTAGGYGPSTGTTVTSSSFTPAAGALVGCITFGANNTAGGGGTETLTISDSFSGDATAMATQLSLSFQTTSGGVYKTVLAIGWATMGATPGAHTVSVASSHPSAVDAWLGAIFFEVSNQNASQAGAVTGTNSKTTGTSLTNTLSGSPAASSLVFAGAFDWNNTTDSSVKPTGYTDLTKAPDTTYQVFLRGAYINGSGTSSQGWTSMFNGNGACIGIEVLDAGAAAYVAPRIIVPNFAVVQSTRW